MAELIGNLHDRILYGSVVDFIEVHIFGYHWPDFNVADSSIVVRRLPSAPRFPLPPKTAGALHSPLKSINPHMPVPREPSSVTFRSYFCAL